VAAKYSGQISCYAQVNDTWDAEIARSGENLNHFGESLGLVMDDAAELDALADALGDIMNAQRAMQDEERALFQLEKEYQVINLITLIIPMIL